MNSDRGSATFWMLGLSALLLLFGGLAVDLWRALDLQRELAAVADSAVVAAAAGIDEDHYRLTGEVILVPNRARDLAAASIDGQDASVSGWQAVTSSDLFEVSVEVRGELELGLLGVFVSQTEPLEIKTTATATPVRVPG